MSLMRTRNAVSIVLAIAMILSPISMAHGELTDGLEGYWSFDIDFADSSTNGNDGTSGGGVSIDAGALLGSGAGLFDGTGTSFVDIGAPVTEFGDAFTISTWVKTSFVGGDVGILAKSNNDGGWSLHEKQFFLGNDGGGSVGSPNMVGYAVDWMHHNASADVRDGTWHQIAITFDTPGSANNMIYIDGAPVAATLSLNNYNGSNDPAGTLMRIGFDTAGEVDSNYNGLMDEMGVWSRALSAGEIASLYNGGAALNIFNDTFISNVAAGDWNTAGSWITTGVPTPVANSEVSVLDTHVITVQAAALAGTLDIAAGGTVAVNDTLTVANGVTIAATGALDIASGGTVNAGAASTSGVSFVDNSSTLNVTDLSIDTAIDLDTAGVILDGNNITIAPAGSLSMGATPAAYNAPTGGLNVQGTLSNVTDIMVKNITMPAAFAIEDGRTLMAETGALGDVTFGTAATISASKIDSSGQITAANLTILDDTMLIKDGTGRVDFSGTSTVGTGSMVDVNAGHIALAAAPVGLDTIQLNGGTFETSGIVAGSYTMNQLRLTRYNSGTTDNSPAELDDGIDGNGLNGGVYTLAPDAEQFHSGDLNAPILGGADNYVEMFDGVFIAPYTGEFNFQQEADDWEAVWIDFNQNGEFEASQGENILLNVPPENWNVTKNATTPTLTAGQAYNFAAIFRENGGGDFGRFRVDIDPGAGTNYQFIDPGDAVDQNNWWATGSSTTGPIAMSTTDIVVNGNSNLIATTDTTATFGALALNSGIVNISGAAGGTTFSGNTTAAAGFVSGVTSDSSLALGTLTIGAGADVTLGGPTVTATSIDLDTSAIIRVVGDVNPGTYNEGAAATTLTVAGTGNLDMRDLGAAAATGTTFKTQESATLILGGPNPLGGSGEALNLDGGTIRVFGDESTVYAPLAYDFESGDLTGWNLVANGHGPDNLFTVAGNEPVSNSRIGPKQGTFYLDGYSSGANGDGDGHSGIIETDSFILGANAQITMVVGGGDHAWAGDPDAPVANLAGIGLERLVGPGDWENIHWETGGGNALTARAFDASAYEGDTVRLRYYDTHIGGWGWTGVDDIQISSAGVANLAAINLGGTDVIVTKDSRLDAVTPLTATFGALSFDGEGILTTSGADGGVIFADTTITIASDALGFDTEVNTAPGALTVEAGLAATIVKTGAADLILDSSDPTIEAGGSLAWDIQEGRLIARAGSNPLGDGSIVGINGGQLVLTSSSVVTPATFDNAITTTGGTLIAGANGGANVGPLTVTVGNASGNDVTLTSGTLNVQTTDDYTLAIAGNVAGAGNLAIAAGSTVTVAGTMDAGSVTIDGSLAVQGAVNVSELIANTGGSYSGPSNLTVTQTLTLNGDLDLSAATLVVDGAAVTVNNGTLTVGATNPLGVGTPVGSVDLSNGGALALSGTSLRTKRLATTGAVFDMGVTGSFTATGDVTATPNPGSGPVQIELDGGTISVGGVTAALAGPAGALSHWTFDNPADVGYNSITTNSLAANGEAQQNASGKFGGALQLDGNGDFLSGQPALPALGNSPYSIALWINTGVVHSGGMVGWGNYGAGPEVNAFRLDGDNGVRNYWWGNDIAGNSSPIDLENSQWHHIMVTYNGTDEQKLFVDGGEIASRDPSDHNVTTWNNFRIGSTNNGEWFNGMMDEMYIYDRALTPTERDEILTAGAVTANPLYLPDTDILMTSATTIELIDDAVLGDLTVVTDGSPVTLTFTGDSELRLNLASTTLSNAVTGTPGIIVDSESPKVNLGPLDLALSDGPFIQKIGAGELIITDDVSAPAANYTGTAVFGVDAGTLTLGDTGLLGASILNVNGATLKLSSLAAATTYTETPAFAGDVTVLAGAADSDAAPTAVVTLPTINALAGQTLTLGAEADYTLKITNPVTAATVATAGVGAVTLDAGGTATTAVNVTSGTLNIGPAATITTPSISVTETGSLNLGAAQSTDNLLVSTSGSVSVTNPLTVTNKITLGEIEITDDVNMQIVGANLADPTGTITASGSAFTMGGAGSGTPDGLVHRYSFSETGGSGTVLVDSIGGADGSIVEVGANDADVGVTHAGKFYMTGGGKAASDYATLPDGLYAGQNNLTVETWATQESVQNWSRIFSFGPDTNANMIMSWTRGGDLNATRMAFKLGNAEHSSDLNTAYNLGQEYHIVMTLEDDWNGTGQTQMKAYRDGVHLQTLNTPYNLADLTDINNWIGRAKYGDNAANAIWDEFRTYNTVLTPEQITASLAAGPDSLPVVVGDPISLPNLNLDLAMAGPAATINLNGETVTLGDLTTGGITDLTIAGTENASFNNVMLGAAPTTINNGGAAIATTIRGMLQTTGSGILSDDLSINGDLTMGAGSTLIAVGAAVTADSYTNDGGTIAFGAGAALNVTGPLTQNAGSTTFDAAATVSGVTAIDIAAGATLNVAASGVSTGTLNVPQAAVLNATARVEVTDSAVLGELELGVVGGTFSVTGADASSTDVARTVTLNGGVMTTNSIAASTPVGMVHRYSFNETGGSGTVLVDSLGGANGSIVEVGVNDADVGVTHAGKFYMPGGAKDATDYATLPDGLYAGQTNLTVETWATQESVNAWSRIFSFGPDTNANLIMTWTRGTALDQTAMAFKLGGTEHRSELNTAYNLGQEYHIVMTLEDDWNGSGETQLKAYRDGVLVQTMNTAYNLADLPDVNNWLGRAKYNDGAANAIWDEFRTYDTVLTPEQITESRDLGPNGIAGSGIDMSNTTFATAAGSGNSTLNLTSDAGVPVALGGLTTAAGTTLVLNSPAEIIGLTKLTMNGSSMIRSTHAADTGSVAVTAAAVELSGGMNYLGDATQLGGDGDNNATNLTLSDGAVIDWTFDGLGSEPFDGGLGFLDVKGNITLDGTLTVNVLDGIGTAAGKDIFIMMARGTIAGDVGDVTIDKPAGWAWDSFAIEQRSPSTWALVLKNATFGTITQDPGDTDGNRIVDDVDLANFQLAFGLGGAELIAEEFGFDPDFDNDGDADLDDFVTLRQYFGTDFDPEAPAMPDLSQTPEPATMSLLALGALAILRRRRRK
jgi:hypothetical protein